MPAATVVRRTRLWSRNGTTFLVRICRPWCATHEHPARPAESAGRATAVAATSTAFGPDVVGARLYAALMGMLRNLFRSAASSKPATLDAGPTLRQGRTDPAPDEGDSYWYVPADAAAERFLAADGLPALHLVPYRDSGGENVLRLVEDSTGLLVGPTHRALAKAGIYVSQLRGEVYSAAACRRGDFSPGARVRLVREPSNAHDANAVAVFDATGRNRAAYVNKQKARALAKLLDAGTALEAVSVRGTSAGKDCPQVAVLAAAPPVLARLLEPRPPSLTRPAHLR